MSECDHDARFRGVMFTKNGCLACELEQVAAQRDILKAAIEQWHLLALEIVATWQESENDDDMVKRARTRTDFRGQIRAALAACLPTQEK